MVRRRPSIRTAVLVRAALVAYLANCALGTAVQFRLLDTRRHRWVHHALYIVTSTLTGIALAVGGMRRSRAAAALAPAVVPLYLLPRAGHRRHPITALAAAPFYAAALLVDGRIPNGDR